MNKYFITGGSGFIGTNLIDYIRTSDSDAEITTIAFEKPVYQVENCKYIVGSIEHIEKYERYLDGNTTVIHLAWWGFPNMNIKNALEGINNNIINSCRLFETAIMCNCKNIIFLSSGGGIYGKPLSVPISETHATNPLSYYGVEKLAAENYLRIMTSQSSTKAVILRPSNPYGRFQRPFTGQGVVATFLASALLNRPIEVWGDGNAVRDYYYIDDLSAAIVRASSVDAHSIVANIGSGVGTSINDIIATIEKVTERKMSVNYKDATSAEMGANILDCSVAQDSFGWSVKYSLEEGIKKMLTSWNPKTEQFDKREIM